MEKTKSVLKSSSRIIIIGIIIVVLIFLSFLMVSVVPKILSSMANATVSVTSAFFPADNKVSNQSANTATNTSTSSGVTLNNPTTTTENSTSSNTENFLTSFFGPRKTDNSNGGSPATFVVATSSRQSSNYSSNQTNNKASYNDRNTNYQKTGSPDLAVQITSVGISSSNGSFVATNNFTTSDTVVVKFIVQNIGTGPTGAWSMKVNMPSSNVNDQVRTISANSLPAGAAVSGQAVFNTPTLGSNQQITVSVDPNGYILESNENNNKASAAINVTQAYSYNNSYNSYNNNNNYYNASYNTNCINGYTNGIYTGCTNNSGYNYNNCTSGYINTYGVYTTGCNNYNYNYGNYNNYGSNLPNLTATFISIGKIDISSGQFIPTTYFRPGDKVAVNFSVTNYSSVYTSTWVWKATLVPPVQYNNYYGGYNLNTNYNGYVYNSDGSRTYILPTPENGLAPGETRNYTATFDNVGYGSNYLTIMVDSGNNINESNESDNTIGQSFLVTN